jgi:ribosomal protein S18 acetylase RimI-like enzyme
MPLRIEAMTLRDYDEMVALWAVTPGVGLTAADSRADIAAFLRRNRGMSFVARDGAKLAGTVLCGHDARRGYLYHLTVAPAWRGRGLGDRLVRRGMESLRRAGLERCLCFVYHANAGGKAFWTRVGWTEREDVALFSLPLRRRATPRRTDRPSSRKATPRH